MKKSLLIIMVLLALSVTAYTPPAGDAVKLVLTTDYSPPAGDAVQLVIGEVAPPVDSCSDCDGSANCIIQCSDSCNFTSNIDNGGFNITFNGTGHVRFINANLTNYETETTISGCRLTFE